LQYFTDLAKLTNNKGVLLASKEILILNWANVSVVFYYTMKNKVSNNFKYYFLWITFLAFFGAKPKFCQHQDFQKNICLKYGTKSHSQGKKWLTTTS
jgi:hypothetical protein